MRTALLALCVWLCALPVRAAPVERAEVNLDYVAKLAEERARTPFHSPRADMPEALREEKLNYDNYRKIRFRHDHALTSRVAHHDASSPIPRPATSGRT